MCHLHVSKETSAGRPTYKHKSQRRGRGSGGTGIKPGSQTDNKKNYSSCVTATPIDKGKGDTLTILVWSSDDPAENAASTELYGSETRNVRSVDSKIPDLGGFNGE
jgi:hypothetical protein